MHLWVIGAGGLLGSSLTRKGQDLEHAVATSRNVPWNDPGAALEHLKRDASRFFEESTSHTSPWTIIWSAGKVTTASPAHDAELELDLYSQFVKELADIITQNSGLARGTFCLVSSAGGVYAGSSNPPFTSDTVIKPLGTYGELKAAQERVTLETLGSRCGVLIARVANLYGPGQDLTKLQGLISRLAWSAITREPLTMFVPLDTLRDYVYVDDAASTILQSAATCSEGSQVQIVASGESVSLGYLIHAMQGISHSRIPIAYGIHASARAQAHDLRLVPDRLPHQEAEDHTPLPAGMKTVYLDILQRRQSASVSDNH